VTAVTKQKPVSITNAAITRPSSSFGVTSP